VPEPQNEPLPPVDPEATVPSATSVQSPSPTPALVVPEYAQPLQAELTHDQYVLGRIAAWFGALPLALGCVDFLLWIPTRSDVFALGGLLTIFLGLLCTFLGGLLLLIQLCSIRGAGKFKIFFKTSRFAIFLILVNYPVAFLILIVVNEMGMHLF
jgi:hypothetical protein